MLDFSSPMVTNRLVRLAEWAGAIRLVTESGPYKLDDLSMYDD